MKKISETVVFFGSGPVAAKSLELLISHTSIEYVVTKPKQPHSKTTPPVIEVCDSLGIKYHTVDASKAVDEVLQQYRPKSKLGIVIDFGFIITDDVINLFTKGIVNSHFSLLPQWRGADPITYSLLSGQHFTGVTLMSIVKKMDEGDILATDKIGIASDETNQSLTNKLIHLSDTLLKNNLENYIKNDIKLTQQKGVVTYSRKLTKHDGEIDLSKNVYQIEREIRAYSSWPKSSLLLGGMRCIISKCHVSTPINDVDQLVIEDKKLYAKAKGGYLSIDTLKPEGKKEMPVEAFLAGYQTKISG